MNWRAYEMDMNIEKEEAREEGLAQGIAQGLKQGIVQGRSKAVKCGLCCACFFFFCIHFGSNHRTLAERTK